MLPIALVLALSWVISLAATALVRRAALALGVVDSAQSSRKIHHRSVPRLGGLGIVCGIYGALALGLLFPSIRATLAGDGQRIGALAIGALAVAAVGLCDDLRDVRARTKLLVQFAAAALLYASGFRIDHVDFPFGADILLGPLSLPVTLLWIAGLSNALNLIDGLDGLAGGVAVAAALATLFIGVGQGPDLAGMLVAAATVGGVMGFLAYNVVPASIFMGDSGSLFLGVLLGALAIRPHARGSGGILLVAMGVVLALPIADTALAILRRVARGSPAFSADREHLHHRLIDAGLSHGQAVLVLWTAAALLAAAGVHLASGMHGRTLTLAVVLVTGALLLHRLGMFTFTRADQSARRRDNRELYDAVRVASRRLRVASHLAEVREELSRAGAALQVRSLRLRTNAETPPLGVSAGELGARTRFVLDASRPELGALEVAWSDLRSGRDRDAEIAFELLSRDVATALRRIRSAQPPEPRLAPGAGRPWRAKSPGSDPVGPASPP
ncbi:glycosyltransferase family 4 protein [Anaeromyxobacter diazotrophicus]|uniref:Glycosyl transferase family 4 n=1 Tax=Anaeromyxobacter diazotrophicus TaxID=2590199 RepID=A0A7I9VMI2_9BACT|nr:MraY family glycosyltransferase [Anaeromyxobacter diazotrophicus]GEJ57612.1 hypothetical protein AMYX_23530 [Anaeromyxobacter diazotrophicus]